MSHKKCKTLSIVPAESCFHQKKHLGFFYLYFFFFNGTLTFFILWEQIKVWLCCEVKVQRLPCMRWLGSAGGGGSERCPACLPGCIHPGWGGRGGGGAAAVGAQETDAFIESLSFLHTLRHKAARIYIISVRHAATICLSQPPPRKI